MQSAKDILLDNRFNNLRHTVLYFHGFKEKLEDENQHLIVDSYLKRNDHNMLLVDWEQLAAGNYVINAIPNALRVIWFKCIKIDKKCYYFQLSDAVSNAVLMLLNNGLDINKLHIVSHSLGSHLAGLVSRQIQKKSSYNYKIKRITCLDPAFPLFYPAFFYKGISKSDAEFIDVIHVDSWIYGSPFSVGNADFYPNGGTTLQPGCPPREIFSQTLDDFCSHHRSIRFWTESVVNLNTKLYSSKKCISYTMFKLGRCRENEVANMGIDCSPT